MWKISWNILQVAANLNRRGMSTERNCIFCHGEETIEHMFFCEWTRPIWFSEMDLFTEKMKIDRIEDWLFDSEHDSYLQGEHGRFWIRKLVFTLWHVQKERCFAVFEHDAPQVSRVIHEMRRDLAEYVQVIGMLSAVKGEEKEFKPR